VRGRVQCDAVAETPRLHYENPLLLELDVRVERHATHEGRASVVLDRTIFYPESGGQMADRGTLAGASVVDVQVDEEGVVHHVIDGPLPEARATVRAVVDGKRRRLHMALHTGQHMLSRALLDVAGAATKSVRLGETACTVDVDVSSLSRDALEEAERRVNAAIDEDRPVRAWFPTDEELRALTLRSEPKKEHARLRVVRIEGFDTQACGGTHAVSTAQVELLRIEGVEPYKGGSRVTFSAGPRARASYSEESAILRALARSFDVGPREVTASIDKLRRDAAALRERAKADEKRLAELVAEALRTATPAGEPIVALLDADSPETMRAVATLLAKDAPRVVLLAAPTEGGLQIVAARGEAAAFDCGAFVRRLAEASGARGGGRPDRAEARLPEPVDFVHLARTLL
jgi:alanyl-tRNA synthetase